MKRFLIFAGLGPPIGLAVLFLVLMPGVSLVKGEAPPVLGLAWLMLLFAMPGWALGIVPALAVGALDAVLSRLGVPFRWVACGALGYVFGEILTILLVTTMFGPNQWALGLVGAIPGAFCSWLAARPRSAAV